MDKRWTFFAESLSSILSQYSVKVYLGGILCILGVLIFASMLHHRYHFTKKAFFGTISVIVLSVTATLLVINIQLISNSSDNAISKKTGKMSVFVCGQELSIRPKSSVFTDSSGDSRHKVFPGGQIEFTGYRTSPETDASLGGFFRAIGGSISSSVLAVPYNSATESATSDQASLTRFIRTNPTGEKYLELRSGEACNTAPAMVNVFLYEYNSSSHTHVQQRILRYPEEYILSDQEFSEPVCIVVIFSEPITKTDKTCGGYPDANKVTYGEISDEVEAKK